jgi:hypothetical protein
MANIQRTKQKRLSRREVLVGAAAAALVAGAKSVVASPGQRRIAGQAGSRSQMPVIRYMAASAVLGDGRILITGGYDRPWGRNETVQPMSSAVIYDPHTGEYTTTTPMSVPRARHACVALRDGRVAVIGGMGTAPTASVEVYDPGTGKWTTSTPLSQPRYDHTAAYDGHAVYVFGGSAQSMLTGAETVYPGGTTEF